MVDAADVVFGVLLTAIAAMLLLSYVAFVRMHPDVRQLRLFTMSKRINRFLLAFTVGFLSILVLFLATFTGVALPETVMLVGAFVFLGSVLYGSLEILLIARPFQRTGRVPGVEAKPR